MSTPDLEPFAARAMAYIISKRAEIGSSLADHHLIEALVGAGFRAAEVHAHFDAAKALVFTQRRAA